MRFWKAFLPNVTVALNIVLLIVVYLDLRNPMMGFLIGGPFLTLVILCCACSIATAIVTYVGWRSKKASEKEKINNNT